MKNDEATGLDWAFGNTKWLPAWSEIPEDFRRDRGEARPWVALFHRIFYQGGKGITFETKEGVDETQALGKIMACARSFEPKHEHKTAGCAYMFSQAFKSWSLDGVNQVAK